MIYLLLLIISFITHWRWLNPLTILTSGDWSYLTLASMKEYLSVPYIWSSNGLGNINIGMSFWPFEFLYGLLAHLNIPYAIDEHIVFFLPIAIILPLASYILVKRTVGNTYAAVLGSFVYTYNTYFGELQSGVLTLLIAYALAPLALLTYELTLEKKSYFYALITGLLCFVVSFYEFRAFYILFFVLFFYYLYFILRTVRKLSEFITVSILAGMPFVLVFLLNLYWILPYIKTSSLTSNYYFSRNLFGNEFTNINYAITLFHSFWTGSKTAIFEVQRIPIYEWIIPIVAFSGLIINKKVKDIFYFGFIGLLGVFLTKQVGYPFVDVYLWLYKHFPGFNAFRESSKFYFLIALSYSVLIASFFQWVFTWKTGRLASLLKCFLFLSIGSIFLFNAKPMITGSFATLFVARNMPTDYAKVNGFLGEQSGNFRVLWIPRSSRWIGDISSYPQVNMVDMIDTNWTNYASHVKSTNETYGQIAVAMLTSNDFNYLANISSLKYIMVPLSDNANDDNFIPDYGVKREFYINSLNKVSWLKRISIGTKQVAIYQNIHVKPRIYSTSKEETAKKYVPYQKILFTYNNPTSYSFVLTHVKNPLYLNFSELYSPDWMIHIGNTSLLGGHNNKYFTTNILHLKNDAGLNSYYINPVSLCSSLDSGFSTSCEKNTDGTFTLYGSILFAPQVYVYIGSFISLATVLFIFVSFFYLGYITFKQYV